MKATGNRLKNREILWKKMAFIRIEFWWDGMPWLRKARYESCSWLLEYSGRRWGAHGVTAWWSLGSARQSHVSLTAIFSRGTCSRRQSSYLDAVRTYTCRSP